MRIRRLRRAHAVQAGNGDRRPLGPGAAAAPGPRWERGRLAPDGMRAPFTRLGRGRARLVAHGQRQPGEAAGGGRRSAGRTPNNRVGVLPLVGPITYRSSFWSLIFGGTDLAGFQPAAAGVRLRSRSGERRHALRLPPGGRLLACGKRRTSYARPDIPSRSSRSLIAAQRPRATGSRVRPTRSS
jgi:hypothetical protein